MDKRDQKGREDRQRQQDVRDGDHMERDKRHPDQIEQRRRDGNDFGPEPVQPAENEFPLLIMVEPARPGQELAPVFLHDLHRTTGPTSSLSREGQIVLRQQSPAIAAVGVMGTPTELHDRQPEIAVLANRVA